MSKEKLKNLQKYSTEVKNKLSDATPKKHGTHPESYRLYLQRELEMVTRNIAKLVETK